MSNNLSKNTIEVVNSAHSTDAVSVLLADVVLDIPTKSLDSAYTYEIPNSPEFKQIEIGCAVKVPFGRRTAVGFVCSIRKGESFSGLKTISEILSQSFFNEQAVECGEFLSKRYVAPLSVCIRLFTPPGSLPRMVQTEEGKWRLADPKIGAVDDRWISAGPSIDEFEPRKNAVKQIAVLEAAKLGDIKVSELSAMYGSLTSTLRALESAGAIKVELRRRVRGSLSSKSSNEKTDSQKDDSNLASVFSYESAELPKDLTDCQREALEKISDAYEKHSGNVVLVDGVTGSGKTEVYLQSISRALADGKTAIMLVPEIALTPQTVARFHARFGDTVAVLHSRMSDGERFDQWEMIREGFARVVVGARSALFAPLENVGVIVIDEEHESTYKQESAPRYVTRDVASWMARKAGAVLILGSATPSIEALYRANTLDDWDIAVMHKRVNGRGMPPVEIVDMTTSSKDSKKGGKSPKFGEVFSPQLATEIKNELSLGNKVVLLLNQRGFAQFMLCQDCGFVARCTSCSTTLTYHAKSNNLVCHHCGYTIGAPATCPLCSSPYLMKRGVGTERVESELRSLLDAEIGVGPEIVPIIRMDADTTSRKGAHERLLNEFGSAPRAVLLGTQMIAKGLDFEDVTLVGVVNADTQLNLPDFRASERTFDLIEQVAGRAGRGERVGKVMVQTHQPENVAIVAAANYDRDLFLRSELPKRRVLKYPPFVRMANILVWGKNQEAVSIHAKNIFSQAKNKLEQLGLSDWDILEPVPCVFEKIRSDWRWHFIVKCPTGQNISKFLTDLYLDMKKAKDINVAIDIDPIDLL